MRASIWLSIPLLLAGCAASTPAPQSAPAAQAAAPAQPAAPSEGAAASKSAPSEGAAASKSAPSGGAASSKAAPSGGAASPSAESAKDATPSHGATAASAAQAGPQTLGDPLPAGITPVRVGEVVRDAASWDGKKLALEGTVTKMCKKKGCWFELADAAGGPGVLIKSSRYHIFLNQGSEGRRAVAYGEFKREVQDLAEAQHLAQDAGEPVPTEAPVVLRLMADGVELR
jgi:hypothetical protein